MIYKFRSKAAGDVIMLGANGRQVLTLMGKAPDAKGILEPGDMPGASAALQAAIEADDQRRAEQGATDEPGERPDAISLRQRAWPLVEMMKRAHAADEPITWGV